ncbi:MAG TPA: hypothetical protein PKY58_05795 [Syntrophales bacterium]|nr:hypothetical protein [Syntrophales bacterium]HQB31426.1 hypothetical protein [Syntrophales bacterium]HQN77855.1 hypothetical protein [Syntrophales bacterium]HQQ27022.1 hypothetical protein [Syntrophales bacterium]
MMIREKGYDQTQEDILRERANVLARAGDSVWFALERLRILDGEINRKMELYRRASTRIELARDVRERLRRFTADLVEDINDGIVRYNEAREYAKVRYYYLIVTREAMGFRRHQTVEEIYRIPEKKRTIEGPAWIDSRQ